jgi:uncharacterized protein YndB with AHSA1/START domain
MVDMRHREETMADLQIEREVLVEAPIEIVWRTISEPEQITRWFADRVELDPVPGGSGTFVFENDEGEATHTTKLAVEAVEPPRRLAYRWSAPAGEEPVPGNSTLVEFTLAPEGEGRTRLRVTETGLELTRWPDEEKARFADDHGHGWEHQLGRLVALYAAG